MFVLLSSLILVESSFGLTIQAPDAPPPNRVSQLPPATDSPAFLSVRDRRPLEFGDNAAYAELLRRARDASSEQLNRSARKDVVFSQLLSQPARYRGLPIHLQGTARRILIVPDVPATMAPAEQLYEAWVFTSDSQGFPYALVFEDLPEGLPLGDDVNAFVVFRGYFLKLMAYRAGDKPRVAPLLIGKLEYVPQKADSPFSMIPADGTLTSRRLWYALPLSLVAVYALMRIVLVLQRTFAPRVGPHRYFKPHHNQEISPEALQEWLTKAVEPDEQRPENEGPDPRL